MRYMASIFIFLSLSVHAQEALLLYGGKNHDEFIGCINCDKYNASSVCNKYEDYGSKYSDKSIWNKFGDYGSKFSDKSPWNKFASTPPVIVDQDGGFYGYFASNKHEDRRTEIELLVYMLDNVEVVLEDLENARDWLCD